MNILAVSDLHGYLPDIKESFDLLLICGDICPSYNHFLSFQQGWIENEFVEWVNSLKYNNELSKVVMIFGNHDFIGERMGSEDVKNLCGKTNNRLVILQNEEYLFDYYVGDVVNRLKIYGFPYCLKFYNWAYMINEYEMDKMLLQIPADIDILITHDSPTLNKLGAIQEGRYISDTTGNPYLTKCLVNHYLNPKMYFSGHFHSGNHNFENVEGIYMANVSYVNESYQPRKRILKVVYDGEKNEIIRHEFVDIP